MMFLIYYMEIHEINWNEFIVFVLVTLCLKLVIMLQLMKMKL
jgi:hypothetical protein